MMLSRADYLDAWRSWLEPTIAKRGPLWLHLLMTGGVSLAIGTALTMGALIVRGGLPAGSILRMFFLENVLVSFVIGYAIHFLHALILPLLGDEGLRRLGTLQRTALFATVPILGTALGWPLGLWLIGVDVVEVFSAHPAVVRTALLISVVLTLVLHFWARTVHQKAEAEKLAAEAQMRLLQAQMEPHFLFNTLANVLSLMDHDMPRAKQMLETFNDYLRASLAQLRSGNSTLGAELALAQAYLQLLQTRMEDRLRFRVDVDPSLHAWAVPPLLLQPLVENAVHHGLEPKLEGGTVTISAFVRDRQLIVAVQDDGLGPDAPRRLGARQGAGVALKNLRARLHASYGPRAALALAAAPGGGAMAQLTLPPLPEPSP